MTNQAKIRTICTASEANLDSQKQQRNAINRISREGPVKNDHADSEPSIREKLTTPLSTIIGYSELLIDAHTGNRSWSNTDLEDLDKIRRAGIQLASILDEFSE